VPLGVLDSLLGRCDRSEDGKEALNARRWELDREAGRVNEPTEDYVARGPDGITFLSFFTEAVPDSKENLEGREA
jgi:hypothetical protein